MLTHSIISPNPASEQVWSTRFYDNFAETELSVSRAAARPSPLSRGSAHKIEFARQIHQNRGRVWGNTTQLKLRRFAEILHPDCVAISCNTKVLLQNRALSEHKICSQIALVQLCGIALGFDTPTQPPGAASFGYFLPVSSEPAKKYRGLLKPPIKRKRFTAPSPSP